MMKHPEFDQMVALAERLRLELDSSDRKNLVGSQIIPDKSCRPLARNGVRGDENSSDLRQTSLHITGLGPASKSAITFRFRHAVTKVEALKYPELSGTLVIISHIPV
jgi:hypothetical protein